MDEVKIGFTEGTREELFNELDLWSSGQFPPGTPKRFYFLSGGAGMGKTAIAHRFCSPETFESKEYSLGGSFFFVRGSLESVRPLFPTIAHQLASSQPLLCPHIISAAREYVKHGDNQQMQYGFHELLHKPLLAASRAASHTPPSVILVIDGLDECKDRLLINQLLHYLLALGEDPSLPWLRIFIAARPEPYIMVVLAANRHVDAVHHRSLNDTVDEWSGDVERYLEVAIPEAWGYVQYLEKHPEDLRELIRRAKGFFIYARMAVSFLGEVNGNCGRDERFDVLLRSKTFTALPPLGRLYMGVLQSAFPPKAFERTHYPRRREALRLFLQLLVLEVDVAEVDVAKPLSHQSISLLSGQLDEALGLSIVDNLRSVLCINKGKVVPIHATFTEFLTDEESCNHPLYHVEKSTGNAHIASTLFKLLPQIVDKLVDEITRPELSNRLNALRESMSYMQVSWSRHLAEAEYTEELMADLRVFIMSSLPIWLALLTHHPLSPILVRRDLNSFFQVSALFLSPIGS